ncbi:MAG: Hsp20/alpha crystallin family protein [Candidatus Altiarchaeota archaeon]
MKPTRIPGFLELFNQLEKEFEEGFGKWENDFKATPGANVTGFSWGYEAHTGPDGVTKVREYRQPLGGKPEMREWTQKAGTPHVLPDPVPRLPSEKERTRTLEPVTDLIENTKDITLLAELPGVDKKDINLDLTEEKATISVDTPTKNYKKEILLQYKVKPKSAKARYKNGVLEVKLEKEEPQKAEDKRFRVNIG